MNIKELLLNGNPITNNSDYRQSIEDFLPNLEMLDDIYTVYGNINNNIDESLYNILPAPLLYVDDKLTDSRPGSSAGFNSSLKRPMSSSGRPMSASSRPGTAGGDNKKPLMRPAASISGVPTYYKTIDTEGNYMECLQKLKNMRNEINQVISSKKSNNNIKINYSPSVHHSVVDEDIEVIKLSNSVRNIKPDDVKPAFSTPIQSPDKNVKKRPSINKSKPVKFPSLTTKRLSDALNYSRKYNLLYI